MTALRSLLLAVVLLLAVAAIGVFGFVRAGTYAAGADVPHPQFITDAIEQVRDRSVEAAASRIDVPPLADPALVTKGAAHYAAMCTECHLAPGVEETELRAGLYPQPPKLAEVTDLTPAVQFWVIKHGLKMTAMPAWGTTHDDAAIWAIVAFLQELPGMSAATYAGLAGPEARHHEDAPAP